MDLRVSASVTFEQQTQGHQISSFRRCCSRLCLVMLFFSRGGAVFQVTLYEDEHYFFKDDKMPEWFTGKPKFKDLPFFLVFFITSL